MTVLNWQGNTLNHSHSAAETLAMCERKWFYSYVMRLETPSSPAAEFGSICHDILERLCKAGEKWADVAEEAKAETPNNWRVLEAVFPNLPWVRLEGYNPWPMPPHWHSETRVDVDAHGLPFKGFIDLWTYHHIPSIDDTKKSLVISDLKVSGDPMKWGKDADQLARFGQPLKYAYAICKQEGIEVDRVYAEHLYAKRKGRAKSFVVNARTGDDLGIPWAAVEAHWAEQVKQDSEVMLELCTETDPEKVRDSAPRSCKAFGGCEYKDICPGHPGNFMPFKDSKLQQRDSEAVPPTRREKVSNNALSALGALAGGRKPTTAKPTNPSVTTDGANRAIDKARDALGGDLPPAAQALMAKAALNTQAQPSQPAGMSEYAENVWSALQSFPLGFDDLKKLRPQGRGRFFLKTATDVIAEVEKAHPNQLVVTGKGRDMVVGLIGQNIPAPEPASKAEPTPPVKPAAEAPVGEATVFVGCFPAWTRPLHIDEAFAHFYTEAEAKLQVTYWLADKYGEGVKMVLAQLGALAVARKQKGQPIVQQDLFIPRDHALATGFVGILRRHGFTRIVQG